MITWAAPYGRASRQHALVPSRAVHGARIALCGVVIARTEVGDGRERCRRCARIRADVELQEYWLKRLHRGSHVSSRTIAKLERRGLVEMTETDERTRWSLTAAGLAIVEPQLPLKETAA